MPETNLTTLADLTTGTVSTEREAVDVPNTVSADLLREATGWTLRPEGLCREDLCVPVRDREALEPRPGQVVLERMADQLGLPLAFARAGSEQAEQFAVLGRPQRSQPPLEAPDFELPDLDGNAHELSEFRGRKVLLIAWASW